MYVKRTYIKLVKTKLKALVDKKYIYFNNLETERRANYVWQLLVRIFIVYQFSSKLKFHGLTLNILYINRNLLQLLEVLYIQEYRTIIDIRHNGYRKEKKKTEKGNKKVKTITRERKKQRKIARERERWIVKYKYMYI